MTHPMNLRSVAQQLYVRALSTAWRNRVQLYDPSQWLIREPELEEKALRDADIAHAVGYRRHLIAGKNWQVTATNPNSRHGQMAAHVAEGLLRHIKHFTQARMNLARAFFSGARFGEIVLERRTLKIGDGKPRTWAVPVAIKDMDKMRFRIVPTEKDGVIKAHWQVFDLAKGDWCDQSMDGYRRTIRHVYADDEATLGHGRGLREALGWWWYAKEHVFHESLGAVEKFARGILSAKVRGVRDAETGLPNSTLIAEWQAVLEDMNARNVLVYDSEDTVEMVRMDGTGWQLMSTIRGELRSAIFTLILGANLTTSAESGGSYALAEIQENSTEALIQFDRESLEETLSDDLIGCLWHFNAGNIADLGLADEPTPRFKITQEKKNDPKQRVDVASMLHNMGVDLPLRDLYEQTGFRMPEPGEPKVDGNKPAPPGQPGQPGGQPGGGMPFVRTPDDFENFGDPRLNDTAAERFERQNFAGAWDESKHPRDDHGRFVNAHEIEQAKTDPAKAEELRGRVNDPEQRQKLESALAGKTGKPKPKKPARESFAPRRGADYDEAYDDGAKAAESLFGTDAETQGKAIREASKHPEYSAWIMGWSEKVDELGRAETARKQGQSTIEDPLAKMTPAQLNKALDKAEQRIKDAEEAVPDRYRNSTVGYGEMIKAEGHTPWAAELKNAVRAKNAIVDTIKSRYGPSADRAPVKQPKTIKPASVTPMEAPTREPTRPRGDNGRLLHHDDIVAALTDPAKADALRQQVNDPAQREKLDSLLKRTEPVEKYGMTYDRDNEPVVDRAREIPDEGWNKLPVVEIPPGTELHANESHLNPKPINKVVSGAEPFREGYVVKLWNENGQLHVVDGHHRVAMYHALGKPMPARIMGPGEYAAVKNAQFSAGDAEILFAAWAEDKHPRDDHGRFVSKGDIEKAKKNPKMAAEIRSRVTDPEERAKLEKQLGGRGYPESPKKTAESKAHPYVSPEALKDFANAYDHGAEPADDLDGAMVPKDVEPIARLHAQNMSKIAGELGLQSESAQMSPNTARDVDSLLADAKGVAEQFGSMIRGAAKSSGGMAWFGEGDKHMLKSRESLSRKVRDRAAKKGESEETVAAGISDAVRGSIIFKSPKQISAAVKALKQQAEAAGAKVSVDNKWTSPADAGYAGVHMAITMPTKNGGTIQSEVQFHLDSMYDGSDDAPKEKAHHVYEVVREDKDMDRIKRGNAAMMLIYAAALAHHLGGA